MSIAQKVTMAAGGTEVPAFGLNFLEYMFGTYGSDTSTTFSSVNFGTADSTRYIFVTLFASFDTTGKTVTGVTIGGVAATELVGRTASFTRNTMWYAAVPSGTSGDIVVSRTAGGSYLVRGHAFSLYGAWTLNESRNTAGLYVNLLDVNAGDTVLYSVGGQFTVSSDVSWTSVSPNAVTPADAHERTIDNWAAYTQVAATTTTAQTATATHSGTNSYSSIIAASFTPA